MAATGSRFTRAIMDRMTADAHAQNLSPDALRAAGERHAAQWIADGHHWDGVKTNTEAADYADGVARRASWGEAPPTSGLPNQGHRGTMIGRHIIIPAGRGHVALTHYGIGCLTAWEKAGRPSPRAV